jgi:cytochrome c
VDITTLIGLYGFFDRYNAALATPLEPEVRDIATKYASRPGAQNYLAHKIVDGSSGVWGKVPMPANTQVSAAQAAALAGWILSLK